MQFTKLAAGEQLCCRCTHRKLYHFKIFKSFSWKIINFELCLCCCKWAKYAYMKHRWTHASVLTWIWSCSPVACLVNYQFLPCHSDLSLCPQCHIPAAYFDSYFQSPVCLMPALSRTSTYATAAHSEAETLACDSAFSQGMVPASNQNMRQ
jgi:hypothetical protein